MRWRVEIGYKIFIARSDIYPQSPPPSATATPTSDGGLQCCGNVMEVTMKKIYSQGGNYYHPQVERQARGHELLDAVLFWLTILATAFVVIVGYNFLSNALYMLTHIFPY